VSISIPGGESAILLGANGAGKTTLFSLICGLFAADQGSIAINGRSLMNGAEALAPLGIVFQSQTLDLDLSVEQNLLYFCALHGISRSVARSRIAAALDRLDLQDRRHHKVRTLNGGHRRRVEIARATLHEPSILLLDEPTVGLDIPTRTELIRYIHELPSIHGCAVLWATHLIDEIDEQDRVLILHQGRLQRDGLAQQLCEAADVPNLALLMQQVMAR
jgi:ABC-2 type transport system ATP-binding protein